LDNERFWRIFVWTVLLAGAVVMFLPFLWLLSSSLKTELAIFRYPPEWIPDPIKFSNYVDAWTTRPFALYVRNTIVILLLNEVAVLVSASFCAYGFARIDFPGRNIWFAILLATVMLPGIVTMIPQFVIFSRIGWVNTILPLTVPFFFGGGAFNIFTFIGTWNDFMGPLLYLAKDPNKFTVALGLAMFRTAFAGRTRWDLLMAASTMMIIPVIFVFFVAQRYFIQGIAISGLKG